MHLDMFKIKKNPCWRTNILKILQIYKYADSGDREVPQNNRVAVIFVVENSALEDSKPDFL